MKLTKQTIRRRKRFSGDLRSWILRHGLTHDRAAEIIGIEKGSVPSISKWITGACHGPQLGKLEKFRIRMVDYDRAHRTGPGRRPAETTPRPDQIQLPLAGAAENGPGGAGGGEAPLPSIVIGQGIRVTITGPGLSYEGTLSREQLAPLLSIIYPPLR